MKLSQVKEPVFLAHSFCFIIKTKLEWSYVCHKNEQNNNVNRVDTTSPMIHLSQSIISIPFNEKSLTVYDPKRKIIKFNLPKKKNHFHPDSGYKAICFTYNLTDYTQKLTLWWTCESCELATKPPKPREPAEQQRKVQTEVSHIRV